MTEAKPKFKRFFLPNGAEVILVQRPEKYTAAISGYLKAGSAYENLQTSGSSHFVEHLLLRGNKKFQTVKSLDEERDRLGLTHSASTDYDHITYTATFPPQEMEDVLEFTSNLFFESLLDPGEIEKERQVILEEERLRKDNVGIQAWDLTLKTRLKKNNHPLTLPREGLPENIKKLAPQTLKNFYQTYFHCSNLTLVIGSNFKFSNLQKLCEKVFLKFPRKKPVFAPNFSLQDYSKFKIAVDKRGIKKSYLFFTFPAISHTAPQKDRSAINLLSTIFRRIRLDKRLYQEKGLSYDWDCGWSVPADPIGVFWVYSSCEPKNTAQIIKIFFEELKKIQSQPVKLNELDRVRNYLNKTTSMEFDFLTGAVDWFLDDFFYFEKLHSPEEITAVRNKITPEFLHKIAAEIIDFSKLNVSVTGHSTQKQVEKIVKDIL